MSDTNPLRTFLYGLLGGLGLPSVAAPATPPVERLQALVEAYYAEAYPEQPERVAEWIQEAFTNATENYFGFVQHAAAMADLAFAVRPFCQVIAPLDYLEILYVVATKSRSATTPREEGTMTLPKEKKLWVV